MMRKTVLSAFLVLMVGAILEMPAAAVAPVDVAGTTWYLNAGLSAKAPGAGSAKDTMCMALSFNEDGTFTLHDTEWMLTLTGTYAIDAKNVAALTFDEGPLSIFVWDCVGQLAFDEDDDEEEIEITAIDDIAATGTAKIKANKEGYGLKLTVKVAGDATVVLYDLWDGEEDSEEELSGVIEIGLKADGIVPLVAPEEVTWEVDASVKANVRGLTPLDDTEGLELTLLSDNRFTLTGDVIDGEGYYTQAKGKVTLYFDEEFYIDLMEAYLGGVDEDMYYEFSWVDSARATASVKGGERVKLNVSVKFGVAVYDDDEDDFHYRSMRGSYRIKGEGVPAD